MSSFGFPDGQSFAQWLGAPIVAGNFAVGAIPSILKDAAALGNYQNLLCYVSPGGASAVRISYRFTLADTGAGVVSAFRSVVCPPGMTSVFTIPALTNVVQVKATSNAGVSADICVWPTNQPEGWLPPEADGTLLERFNVVLAAGAFIQYDIPVFAGRVRFTYIPSVAGSAYNIQTQTLAGANSGILLLDNTAPLANVYADLNLPLGWNRLTIAAPAGSVMTFYASIIPERAV